jgi:hypothetical protein
MTKAYPNLDVLYGGLGINKLQFRIRIESSADPKHWLPQPVLLIRTTLMRIRILNLFHFADPDTTFHPDADPDPDPSFQINAQTTFEKVLK